jgi:hypothetical protein
VKKRFIHSWPGIIIITALLTFLWVMVLPVMVFYLKDILRPIDNFIQAWWDYWLP